MSNNIDLIDRLYRAYRGGDHATFESLCHPELEWIQNEGFPYGGSHVGPRAVISGVFEKLASKWEGFGFDIDEQLDAGSHVVVVGAYRGRHRESGRSFRAAAVHVFDLEEGRVRRFRQFTDTALIRDAAGL